MIGLCGIEFQHSKFQGIETVDQLVAIEKKTIDIYEERCE